MDSYHVPVLLKEAIYYLNIRPNEKYIDATLGGGGHTAGILEAGGVVLGIDEDLEAVEYNERDKRQWIRDKRLFLAHGNFAHLKEIADQAGFGKVAGVLFDLGVSSHQLEAGYRGFSFDREGKLDMRLDPTTQKVTAADLVNAGSFKELANLFWRFGEEKASFKVAKAIVAARKRGRIATTKQLAKIVLSVRKKNTRLHPATKIFQALRLAVNDELGSLESALPQAVELLKPEGRLVVISFHSLEDRIVKNFLRGGMNENIRIITNKPVRPSSGEIEQNLRARSGKLRAAEKI